MANIKRTKTDDKVHLYASSIKAYQVNKSTDKAVFSCVLTSQSGADGEEKVYTATPNMLRRLMTGNGAIHKDMQHGIKALPHFYCVLLTSKEKPTLVEGVHMIPTENYNAADASIELEMPVASDAAIVQVHASGELDILAFPHPMYTSLHSFVTLMEKQDKFEPGDQLTSGNTTYTVQRVIGDIVHFRCRKAATIR